jgi:hypothetical protein
MINSDPLPAGKNSEDACVLGTKNDTRLLTLTHAY